MNPIKGFSTPVCIETRGDPVARGTRAREAIYVLDGVTLVRLSSLIARHPAATFDFTSWHFELLTIGRGC